MTVQWVLVDTEEKLKSSMEDAGHSPLIGLDTEYDSFRYFREKLCLIQISTRETIYLYDPLGPLDFSCLGDIFTNQAITKIIHAAGNDIRFLKRDYGFEFHTIFDTHKAASLLGTVSLSLPSVIGEYLNIEITKAKKLQRSRWDIRPLSEEQLDYAARDTHYLIALYHAIEERLAQEGLTDTARQAFAGIAASRWTEKAFDPEGYLKIKGCEDLTDIQKGRLRALHRWRFEKARAINRARFMILSNQQMLALSQEEDLSLESLNESDILARRPLNEWGREIVTMVTQPSHEVSEE